jgi:hypothetical protein
MRHYCTFFLRADNKDAAADIFESSAVQALAFEDEQSPIRLASSKRMRAAGLVMRNDLPRFTWNLDTRQTIGTDECDPFVHVSWLLSQLKPGVLLAEARSRGVESSLGFYWGGRGTGGGPFISHALAELLMRHQIDLDVGFYYEDDTHNDESNSAA